MDWFLLPLPALLRGPAGLAVQPVPQAQEHKAMIEDTDWDELRALAQLVFERGAALELTEATCDLLRRTAQQVAIREETAEEALRSTSSALALLSEVRRRIRDGSNRLADALHRAYRLRDAGDLTGARKLMKDLLEVEPVPLYREQAEILLEELA
jgi:DUSAM domain-containing protein